MTTLSLFKYRFACGSQKGFTLVELIVTIVLVGIIGVFTTLFVYTGLNGYLTARDTSEAALRAQIALDRLSVELRDINIIDTGTYAANSRMDYTSRTLTGDRQILFSNGVISVNGGNGQQPLLDDVDTFTMAITKSDLNGDGNDDVEAIDISFDFIEERSVGRQFSARIFPRNLVPAP